MAAESIAKKRAFCDSVSCWATDVARKARLNWRNGLSVQNLPISVCSGVRPVASFLRERIAQLTSTSEPDRDNVDIAAFHALLGETEQAFKELELAFAKHASGLVRLKEDLRFDNVRADRRFADLVRRVGLPQ